MRIVHVAPTSFGPGGIFGGGERYPLELARALAAQVECELITFGSHSFRRIEPGGLRLRQLQSYGFWRGHPAQPISPGVMLARGDLLHVHHMRSLPCGLAALSFRLRRKPAVVTDHGLQGGDWLGLLPRLFERFLTVSAYSARQLGAPVARTRVIYGGADPQRYCPRPAVRRQGVLFVGRLTPHKGLDRLIEAVPAGARLAIAGSDGHDPRLPERDYPMLLRRLAAGRDVRFLGPVTDADLPALYRSAQVLVLPSVERTCYGREVRVSELLGLVVIEAMASGTPVLASRLGGVPEVVDHGVTGYLVEPGNVEELRGRLAELLADRAKASRMGQAARDRVLDRFTWQAVADRCLEAYGELSP